MWFCFSVAIAVSLGAVVALVVRLFVDGSSGLFVYLYGAPVSDVAVFSYWAILGFPFAACLISDLLNRVGGAKRHLNVADVIAAAKEPDDSKSLGWRRQISSLCASFFALAAGASVGQFSPVIVIGAGLGRLGHFFCKLHSARAFYASGAAAAVAATFIAPLSGIAYSLEVILKERMNIKNLVLIIFASLSAYYVSYQIFGNRPLLENSQMAALEISAIGGALFLGAICGLLAVGFKRAVWLISKSRDKGNTQRYIWLSLAAASLSIFALLGLPVLGAGQDVLAAVNDNSFSDNPSLVWGFFLAKLIATVLCVGAGVAGGIFSPLLLIGGTLGLALGTLGWKLLPIIGLPAYESALIAMVSLVAPIIGGPIACIVLALEFSHNYHLTVLVLIALSVSMSIDAYLSGKTYYDGLLQR